MNHTLLVPYLRCAVLCLTLLMAVPACFANDYESKIVGSIEVEGLTRIEEEELLDLISISVGDELKMNELRSGIKRAFRKNVFLDIISSAEIQNGEVRLKFTIKEVPLINRISAEGNSQIPLRQIKKIIPFKEYGDYRPEYDAVANKKIRDAYQRRGYPDAAFSLSINETEKKPLVDIQIIIDEGQPLTIDKIETPPELRKFLNVYSGQVFNRNKIDRAIKKYVAYFKKRKYLNPVAGPYTYKDGKLIIPAHIGPKLEVVFKNNRVFSTRRLKKVITYLENNEVSDELTSEIVSRIKTIYTDEGYMNAQVAAGIETEPDVTRVTFVIFEGEQVILRKIDYSGITLNPDTLAKIVPLVEQKPFNSNLIQVSRESLERFYSALGYLNMQVTDVRKELDDKGINMTVSFLIDEGTQTRIGGIKITGNEDVRELEILEAINIEKDSPFNLLDIGDSRYRVLSLYGQNGFINAVVDMRSRFDGDRAFLDFHITENMPIIIGKIILRGNEKTKAKIIMREFTFESGDHYDIEEVSSTKRRLYKLGLFNEVSMDMHGTGYRDDDGVVQDMVVTVKESNAGSIEFSLGYGDYEEFRGAFDLRYRNIGGYHRQAGFRAEMSSVEQRYILSFREPWLFNRPDVPLKIYLMKEDTRSVNIETREVLYKIDKLSFIAGVEKELLKGLKVGLNYEYSFTDTKDVQPGVILSKEDTGTLGIGSISASLFYDTRDNPSEPSSGMLLGVALKYASRIFLSETDFLKSSFQSAWYSQLHKRVIFAFSLRGGVANSFEDIEEVPLIERYFLGGRTTERGYEHDSLGPKGAQDAPTGGNVFLLTNGEFRFSLGKGFGLVTFIDAGNVWRIIDNVDLDLKYVAGAGIRYKTPVGPIRLDYGHKLDREPGESSGEFHFSIGHAF